MSRDDLPYETNVTYVTDFELNSTSTIASDFLSSTATSTKPSTDSLFRVSNYTTTYPGQEFYSSYNPETGINIASFLGGILVVLVIYVIYRTKCRKRILKALHKCTMKYFPEDYPQVGNQPEQSEQHSKPSEVEFISESAKRIWKDRETLSRDVEIGTRCFKDTASCNDGNQDLRFPISEYSPTGACERNGCDGDCVINMYFPHLPDMEEDAEQATAQWVQSVRDMDVKERQLNGILLKIPPDLVSHNSKIRSHFNSVTEYGEFDDEELLNISQQRNTSLPCLIERRTRGKPFYANTNYNRTLTSYGYVPLASQENVELECDYRPQDSEEENSSELRVPLDICPIVKIQHYSSRSKRRLTSYCRSSSDDISTSSDDQHVGDLAPVREAKYMRLQKDETELCLQNDKILATGNHTEMAPNCRKKHPVVNHTESVL